MSDQPKPKVETSITCATCKGELAEVIYENGTDFRKHMVAVHKESGTVGNKQMVLHIDCADHHITTYECQIGEVQFHMTRKVERESAMRRRLLRESQEHGSTPS